MPTKNESSSQKITTSNRYTDFDLNQEVWDLETGDVAELRINGEVITSHTAKYENCHVNFVFQDKGDPK